ncbi:MAG: hypothetical protein MUF87_17420 [Anaerolineae bacterium]|nr:hypothetical protein [Anaerolineae bacterium]
MSIRLKTVTLITLFIAGIAFFHLSPRHTADDLIPMPGNPTVSPPDINYQIAELYSAHVKKYETRQLTDYRVAYLVGELPKESLISPEQMQGVYPNLLIAQQWEDVLNLEQESRLDGLIIHQSALPWVDTAWTQRAYAEGKLFAVLDMSFGQRAEVIGDYCSYPVNERTRDLNLYSYSERQNGHHVLMTFWVLLTDDESQRMNMAHYHLQTCGEGERIPGPQRTVSGGHQDYIDSPETLAEFPTYILGGLRGVEAELEMEPVFVEIDLLRAREAVQP